VVFVAIRGVGLGRTRITQHVSLRGEKVENYLGFAKTFEANLPGGMRKLAEAIGEISNEVTKQRRKGKKSKN